jgi:hypothetical protein
MRISNTNLKQFGVDAAGQADKTPPIQTGEEVAPKKAAVEAGGYSPSAEVVQFTTLAKQVPEIRTDSVAQAVLRLKQGHYATSKSAVKTAEALLNAID